MIVCSVSFLDPLPDPYSIPRGVEKKDDPPFFPVMTMETSSRTTDRQQAPDISATMIGGLILEVVPLPPSSNGIFFYELHDTE